MIWWGKQLLTTAAFRKSGIAVVGMAPSGGRSELALYDANGKAPSSIRGGSR